MSYKYFLPWKLFSFQKMYHWTNKYISSIVTMTYKVSKCVSVHCCKKSNAISHLQLYSVSRKMTTFYTYVKKQASCLSKQINKILYSNTCKEWNFKKEPLVGGGWRLALLMAESHILRINVTLSSNNRSETLWLLNTKRKRKQMLCTTYFVCVFVSATETITNISNLGSTKERGRGNHGSPELKPWFCKIKFSIQHFLDPPMN